MKFIKQIAAVGTGIAMLGATMTGALAADLGTLPEPFVASDAYVNVAMVIGAGSADADARSTIQTYMDGLATATTVSGGESYLIETGTNKMNIGDNLTEVKTINFDHDELPSVLASGEFSNGENTEFSYEQKIALSDALEFAYFADNNYESKDPTLGVKIDKNSHILNYTFNFIEPAEDDTNSGNDFLDFEDVDISFLGKTYSVVDAKNSTSYDLELTLMGGHEKDTISIGETKSYTVSGTTYDVELTFVDADECQFAVSYDSGTETTNKLTDGSTDELDDGTVVGVTEVNYMVGATMEILSCEFYLGADKIELKDTQEVKINDEDVDKLKFYVDHTSGNPFKINSWTLEWKADEDMFVTADSSITMPGFESIMISSEGLVTPETSEVVKFRGSSDEDLDLTVEFESGEYTIQLLGSNGTGGWDTIGGAGDNEGLATISGHTAATQFTYNATGDAEGDQYFVVTYYDGSAEGSSYLVEISDSDDTNGVDFKDVISGEELASNIKNATSFSIGDATLYLEEFVEDSYVDINASGTQTYFDRIITPLGLTVYLPIEETTDNANADAVSPTIELGNTTESYNQTSYIIHMKGADKDASLLAGDDINITAGFVSGDKIEATVADAALTVFSGADKLEDPDDDNFFTAYVEDDIGAYIEYDQDPDEDTVDVTYWGEQTYGKVYIASAESSESTSAAILDDSQVTTATDYNLILVGGPCVNSLTASFEGVAAGSCGLDSGYSENVGYLKMFDNGDKVAMVVSGWEVDDTKRAAVVAANPSAFALSGKELVSVSGTGLTVDAISVE